MDKLQTPPIRTPLGEGDGRQPAGLNGGTAKTSKEWYLHWQQASGLINDHSEAIAELNRELADTIRLGTHAERLAAAPDPLDALWTESDRNNVVYQARLVAGTPAWVYLAGTMRGTITPDQRPGDLGLNDTGFLFHATDAAAANKDREYRWSGSAWVEITAPQTPWRQDIDAAGFKLTNAGNIGIGNSLTTMPHTTASANLVVGEVAGIFGDITAATNTATPGAPIGRLNFANYNLATADKRIAAILAFTGTTVNSGNLTFFTWNGGTAAERMRIMPDGSVGIGLQNPTFRCHVSGPGTSEAAFNPANNKPNSICVQDSNVSSGNGGAVIFGAGQGLFAAIRGLITDGSNNTAGDIVFYTRPSPAIAAMTEVLRLTSGGLISLPNLPASNPGAGSKRLWYDPADGNRVKYAP